MYLNLSRPNTSCAIKDTKCISTCDDPTHLMPAKTQKYLNMIDQTYLMPVRTKNLSQHVLTKPLSCQRGDKIRLNMCSPNPTNARKKTKCISTFVDQNPLIPAMTQNASQHVLTKIIQCQRGHKMYLNFPWINPFNASEDTNCASTCVDQSHPIPAKTQNVPQHVLTKPIPSRWVHKMYLSKC
jgi:hypothetical protein